MKARLLRYMARMTPRLDAAWKAYPPRNPSEYEVRGPGLKQLPSALVKWTKAGAVQENSS